MTLTIELPETLAQQCAARGISTQEMQAVVLAVLEIWLAQPQNEPDKPFGTSAVPFVRKLMAQNRELFEALARQ